MSIARGLTQRMKRTAVPTPPPARSQSMKSPGNHIDRAKISSPVELLSTTNMRLNDHPDIATLRHASGSSHSSAQSADDSDHSASSNRSRASSHASRDTLTDASSIESSPISPAPNHLSGYFAAATKETRRSASSGNLRSRHSESADMAVPAIPERALSHSKRAHERVAQKRSYQNINTRGSVRSSRSSREHRTSLDMFRVAIEEEQHPFGKELEQLNEVAEEFGGVVRDAELEADMTAIRERNLAQFCAADYLAEIQPLFGSRFHQPAPMAWI
ncbi:hypothetical protein EJ04DRAFT_356570 [Polyplosphaeria fusca]|uniref:Uncharacterized protein n=1 Tax=Polyplosphaeria fusca TaxID=682080 RepID=A0A9P4R8W6_9PLEO|nr:hypothetical protein EJ04DRAFT_356570 [Polyplosphaeria fusca]